VILDEVRRGTSTYDGFAIAKAVVEYIHTKIGAKCLFATHYHELNTLKDFFPAIESYYASSKKHKDGIIFLYKIVKGVADGSFGIEVAKLADLPKSLITRAKSFLQGIEGKKALGKSFDGYSAPNSQLGSQDVARDQEGYFGAIKDLEKKHSAVLAQNGELERQLCNLRRNIENTQQLAKKLESIDYEELSPKKAFDLLWELKEKLG